MIQTTNHRLVQILLSEGANYYCNGGLYNLHELITNKLNLSTREGWEILFNCELCDKDKTTIGHEIDKCDGLVSL